jgi:hypothetical protein
VNEKSFAMRAAENAMWQTMQISDPTAASPLQNSRFQKTK